MVILLAWPIGQSEFAAAVSGFRDTPKADSGTAECVQRAVDRRKEPARICTISRNEALDADPVAVAARQFRSPRVRLVNLTRFMCDSRRCYAVVGGALVHKDDHHLTAVFATTLGPYLQRVLPEAETARECSTR